MTDKQIYAAWDKIEKALDPVFESMSKKMLEFFRDQADYDDFIRNRAAEHIIRKWGS